MKKTIKLFIVVTLLASLLVGIVPAAAKTTTTKKTSSSSKMKKEEYEKKSERWDSLETKAVERGFIKSSWKKNPGDLVTFKEAAKVIANADANASVLKTNQDDKVMSTSDAMSITRGVYFEACLENPKKAAGYLKIFSNGEYDKFDEDEYVTAKWIYATLAAYKDGKPEPGKYQTEYKKIYSDWEIFRETGKKGITYAELFNIVFNATVYTFYP